MEAIKFETSDIENLKDSFSIKTKTKKAEEDQVVVESIDLNRSGYDLFKSLDADPSIQDSKITKQSNETFSLENL